MGQDEPTQGNVAQDGAVFLSPVSNGHAAYSEVLEASVQVPAAFLSHGGPLIRRTQVRVMWRAMQSRRIAVLLKAVHAKKQNRGQLQ
jgi:hypothetical protein